jgi:hypothetical protein
MDDPVWPEPVVAIDDFCEPVQHDALVRQPLSALSALGFVAAAAWLWPRVRRRPVLGWLVGACGLLAVGTAAQHASGTREGALLDHLGMQAGVLSLLASSLSVTRGLSARVVAPVVLVVAGGAAVATVVWFEERRWVLVITSVAAGLAELPWWARQRRWPDRWLLGGWALFGGGLVLWWIDQQRWGCDPEVPLLHPGWHLATAGALVAWARSYEERA